MRGASLHSLIPLISLARSTPRSRGCWITASTSQSLNLPSRRQRTSIRIMTLMSCMTWSRCITPPTEKKELREYNWIHRYYWPLIGQYWSWDLDTGLSLVSQTLILAFHWLHSTQAWYQDWGHTRSMLSSGCWSRRGTGRTWTLSSGRILRTQSCTPCSGRWRPRTGPWCITGIIQTYSTLLNITQPSSTLLNLTHPC